MAKKKGEHYVDNAEFSRVMEEFIYAVRKADKKGEDRPPVPDYAAECILNIANHYSFKPNFANYVFREEMVSDAIENCLQYITNFNPDIARDKGQKPNAFAYFSQITYFAFLRRIDKEKKQLYIKYKSFENEMLHNDELMNKQYGSENAHENMQEFIENFERSKKVKKRRKTRKKKETPLDKAIEVE